MILKIRKWIKHKATPGKLAKGLSLLLILVFVFSMGATIQASNPTHRVRSGESWWSISRQYGVNYNELARANGRSSAAHVYTGELLVIPGKNAPAPAPTTKPQPPTAPKPTQAPAQSSTDARHVVVRGESWWSIGRKYGINYVTLAQANGKSPQNTIYIGQVLNIPGKGSPAPTTAPPAAATPTSAPMPTQAPVQPPSGTRHVVVRGESWWSISVKYRVNYQLLAQANGRLPSHYIYVGEVLQIPGQAPVTPVPTVAPTAAPTVAPTPVPTVAPAPPVEATPAPAVTPAPALQVVSVDSASDPRIAAEANTYKIIMTPNSIAQGPDPGIGVGIMIKTPNNKTIMIDGGMQQMVDDSVNLATGEGSGELANLKTMLATHANNTVDTWILTHPHNDHARVPAAIIHEGTVSIGQAFGVEYPKHLHDERTGDETALQSAFVFDAYKTLQNQGKYTEISPGLTYSLDGVNIEFLNAYNPTLWRQNDSAAVIRLSFDGSDKVVLLLSDIQEDGAKLLLNRYPGKLKADVVQMAHHALDPLTDLYKQIAPSISLIPAGLSQAARPSVLENANFLVSEFGSTNYFANGQWQIVEIRR